MFFEKYLYKNSNCVVVLSEGSVNYVKERGANNIWWLPNGPDLSLFKPSEIKSNLNSKITNKRPFKIIYAGAHGPANGLDNVIEAARLIQNKPIEITFIGDGSEKNNIIKKSLDYSLKNIKFMKPVSKNKNSLSLSNYDAILYLLKVKFISLWNISNKLYDAYALAMPVITTIPGIINNEVEKYNLGTTAESENPVSLSNAIIKMANKSYRDRLEMGMRAENYQRQFIQGS